MEEFVVSLLVESMHVKRVRSIAEGVVGVLHSASLGIAAIGQGMAAVHGLNTKHALKQVDRMLSNAGINMDVFFSL